MMAEPASTPPAVAAALAALQVDERERVVVNGATLVTTEVVARHFGVSRSLIYKWAESKKLPRQKIGNGTWYDLTAVLAWAKRYKVASKTERTAVARATTAPAPPPETALAAPTTIADARLSRLEGQINVLAGEVHQVTAALERAAQVVRAAEPPSPQLGAEIAQQVVSALGQNDADVLALLHAIDAHLDTPAAPVAPLLEEVRAELRNVRTARTQAQPVTLGRQAQDYIVGQLVEAIDRRERHTLDLLQTVIGELAALQPALTTMKRLDGMPSLLANLRADVAGFRRAVGS